MNFQMDFKILGFTPVNPNSVNYRNLHCMITFVCASLWSKALTKKNSNNLRILRQVPFVMKK